jgi:hypothetical protein
MIRMDLEETPGDHDHPWSSQERDRLDKANAGIQEGLWLTTVIGSKPRKPLFEKLCASCTSCNKAR